MASLDDVVSTMQGAVRNIGQVAQAIQNTVPRTFGTLTLANATLTVVTQPAIVSGSKVFFTPTNATAALLLRTQGLFHSTNTAGTSFTLSTQTGTSAGTETFEYFVINPL